MFSNPIRITLSFFLMFVNFIFLLLPFIIAITPGLNYLKQKQHVTVDIEQFVYLSMFSIVLLVVLYIVLDLIFGFSIKPLFRHASKVDDLPDFKWLENAFYEVKQRFAIGTVHLYVEDSDVINAYAVASLGRRRILVTTGLIQHFYNSSSSEEEFMDAIKGVLGHECSHLMNWDFLSGLIERANSFATFQVQKIFTFVLNLFANILLIIPVVGTLLSSFIIALNNLTVSVLGLLDRIVITPVYHLIDKKTSRINEYRCDRQSAEAIDEKSMIVTLSLLGNDSYTSLFSTHPSTLSRIVEVYKTDQKSTAVHPSYFAKFFGLFSLLFILLFGWYLGEKAKVISPHYSTATIRYMEPLISLFDTSEQYVNKAKELGKATAEKTLAESKKIYAQMDQSLWRTVDGQFARLSNMIITFLDGQVDYSLSKYQKQLKWLLVALFAYAMYRLLQLIVWEARLLFLRNKLNTTELTPIDFVLFEAAKVGNVPLAFQALKKGANIDVVMDNMTLHDFALQHGQKKIARFFRRFNS